MSFTRVQKTRVRPAFPHSFSGKTRITITSSQGYQCSQHSQGSPSSSLKQQLNFMASMNVRSSPFWASLDLILTKMSEPWCFAWFPMKAGDIWQLRQEFWVLLNWELKAKLSGTCKCKATWKPLKHTKQTLCSPHLREADTLCTVPVCPWCILHSPSLPSFSLPTAVGQSLGTANQCLIFKKPKTLYSSPTFKEQVSETEQIQSS